MWFWEALYFALWSSLAVVIAKDLLRIISPMQYIIVSNIFIIFFVLVILILQGFPHTTPLFYGCLLISGAMDTIAAIAYYKALARTDLSLISPMATFTPLFTLVVSDLVLTEKISPLQFLGILLVVAGSYVLQIRGIKQGLLAPFVKLFSNRGVQLSLLSSLIWGVTPIFQKIAITQTSPSRPLFVSLVGLTIVSLWIIPSMKRADNTELISATKKYFWLLVAIGLGSALAQLGAFNAFATTNLSLVVTVMKLSVLFGVIWGGVLFKEKQIAEKLIGASMMVAGAVLLLM